MAHTGTVRLSSHFQQHSDANYQQSQDSLFSRQNYTSYLPLNDTIFFDILYLYLMYGPV